MFFCLKIKIKIHQLKKIKFDFKAYIKLLGRNYNRKNGGCASTKKKKRLNNDTHVLLTSNLKKSNFCENGSILMVKVKRKKSKLALAGRQQGLVSVV